MADNLSVAVTADTSDLRAQLALAQGDVRAFTSETKKLVDSIRAGGDAGGMLRGQLEQVVGAAANAKSNVVQLTSALRDNKAATVEHATGIKAVNDALGGLTAPLSGAIGGLKEFAEVAGIAFVGEMVGKVVEMAKSMAELGDTTIKLAASVGTTPAEFSSMSAAMRIAGGDAEAAARTMERLGANLDTALRDPSSKAADAFRRLGITEEQLKGTNGDLEATLKLLADAFLRTKDSMQKTDAFREILGRGFESLVQYLMHGSAGIDEFKKRAEETGAALNSTTIRALADTGKKMNTLGGAAKALGAYLVANLKSPMR
jgi:hypothetical protein